LPVTNSFPNSSFPDLRREKGPGIHALFVHARLSMARQMGKANGEGHMMLTYNDAIASTKSGWNNTRTT